MKKTKLGLRVWIFAVSLFSFLTGWIFFAHSNKPASLVQSQPAAPATQATSLPQALPTLAPLSDFNSSLQPLQPLQQLPSLSQSSSFFSPRLRSGGS